MSPVLSASRPTAKSSARQIKKPAQAAARKNKSPATDKGLGVRIRSLRAFYDDVEAVKGVDLDFPANQITAIIGPSGCGKSTLVRCINRMHEEIAGAHAHGQVIFDKLNIYNPEIDPVAVRRTIGMVFQKPNPFPTMSIIDNVTAGLRLSGVKRDKLSELAENALRDAGLWDEVKHRLNKHAGGLSGGQQQRLCIARMIALEPEVLLMDEPCSALDPQSTLRIEELIVKLKTRFTVILVTHNLPQATRVADRTAFMLDGKLVEAGPTRRIFTAPDDARTKQYVTGKFG
ncbi:MAG TPA: phosphate ABC transporter ATP-binding protein PstB [Candidatus Dormibacteraeota bacterium]|nr:phosphate ABC transporter ATP-binding protein PstB [Candidatus Dormibacteraeota bacterium]